MNGKQKKELAHILWEIHYNSGYDANSTPINSGNPQTYSEACQNLRNRPDSEKMFDLVHHQGSGWSKDDWDSYCERNNKKRIVAIKNFLEFIKKVNPTRKDIRNVLEKAEKSHRDSGFPFGYFYARVFLYKWRSWSW